MDRKLSTEAWPTSRTGAAILLKHAAEYLDHDRTCYIVPHASIERDYHDHKAGQLLDAKADLIVAEARIESWFVDIGFIGCQVEASSIGGVPCIMSEEE